MSLHDEVKTLVFEGYVNYKKDIVSFVEFLLDGDEPVEHMTGIGNTTAHPLKKKGLHESRVVAEFYLPESLKRIVSYITHFLSDPIPVIPQSVWFHKTNDNGYHDVHVHAEIEHACIFYIDEAECEAETKNGVNRFYDFSDLENIDIMDIVPEDGKLVYFDGMIPHSAMPYEGKTNRIVMGINYVKAR